MPMSNVVPLRPRTPKPAPGRVFQRIDIPWFRPLALLAILALLWTGLDRAPSGRLSGHQLQMLPASGELIDARFVKCGEGGPYCVVDGDTIRIGDRRIRLMGFDTPEKRARCEAERLAADRATDALQSWLNRGPFVMSVDEGERAVDRYGRDLRTLVREEGRGHFEQASAFMVEGGYARIYGGGRRAEWC